MVLGLPKHHRILEKGLMEFPPFGADEQGQKIRDVSGATVRAVVDYLEDALTRARGPGAGADAVDQLAALLNERILDPACHVTAAFLKNPWHGYSYEFLCFLGEFCVQLTGDLHFTANMARTKLLSPWVVLLGKPFSIAKIYELAPQLGQQLAKGALEFQVRTIASGRAVLRMAFAERIEPQFGRHRCACAALVCDAVKSALGYAPERIHGRVPAAVKDLVCMADGEAYCEWELAWDAETRVAWFRGASRGAPGEAGGGPELGLLQQQLLELEARHEQLREAYLDQQLAGLELRRRLRDVSAASRRVQEQNARLEARLKERAEEAARMTQTLQAAEPRAVAAEQQPMDCVRP